MISKRRLALLSSVSTVPAFAAPFLAIGDNAELFLTASTEVRYEDNVTLSDTNEVEDEIFEFTPGVELLFGKNTLVQGSLAAFERLVAYSDNNDLNSQQANVLFSSSYDGAKLDLSVDAAYRELSQNTRDASLQDQLVEREVYEAGVDAEYALTEKTKLGLGGSLSDTHYKENAFVDQTTYKVPANYYFAITEKVDLSAGFEYSSTDSAAADSDSEDYYFNVGARGEFTPKLSGSFNIGYTTRESDNPDADGEGTLGLRAGLGYAYSPKTSFSLDLSNGFETGASADSIETSSVTLGARTALAANWSLRGSIGYSVYDYVSINREDNYLTTLLGVNYVYNEHVNFDASYAFNDNDSNLAVVGFTSNIVRLAANFRY